MASDISKLTLRLKRVLAPLSRKEERNAIKAATTHFLAQINDRAAPRFRVLGAELQIDKPPQLESVPPRVVRVFIVDYDNKQNLGISVDSKGKVIQREVLAFQPAFHADEIQEAREIAERDQTLARLAKKSGSFVSPFSAEVKANESRRLIGLRYLVASKDQKAELLASVAVDLCDRKIIPIEGQRSGGSYGSVR